MGALNQIVAYGVQDTVLTADPKVTFFQAVYKRHTNFAMEVIEQTINGTAAANGRISTTIARNGDLIGEMYMELTCKTVSDLVSGKQTTAVLDGVAWCAERAVSSIELTIGGQRVDKHYQRWWRLYAELYLSDTKKAAYGKMTSNPTGIAGNKVMLPLLFFFNRNPGLFLPLIALQYAEVRLDFDLSPEFDLYFSGVKVWGNYVFLDTQERYRFAQKGHEYLIEQVQHTGTDSIADASEKQIRLSYNHPVKELVWCCGTSTLGKQLWDLTDKAATATKIFLTCDTSAPTTSNGLIPIPFATGTPVMMNGADGNTHQWCEDGATDSTRSVGLVDQFRLVLNGQDRMKQQSGKYFNQVESMWRHSGSPYPGVYCYSFGLKPEELQPTGTCNFSRIDNAQVAITLKAASSLDMYAVNYNVLKIQSGQGACAFAN